MYLYGGTLARGTTRLVKENNLHHFLHNVGRVYAGAMSLEGCCTFSSSTLESDSSVLAHVALLRRKFSVNDKNLIKRFAARVAITLKKA